MADDTDDPEQAAVRLEVALERIAQLAAARAPAGPQDAATADGPALADARRAEFTAGLDALIARLQAALGSAQD